MMNLPLFVFHVCGTKKCTYSESLFVWKCPPAYHTILPTFRISFNNYKFSLIQFNSIQISEDNDINFLANVADKFEEEQ